MEHNLRGFNQHVLIPEKIHWDLLLVQPVVMELGPLLNFLVHAFREFLGIKMFSLFRVGPGGLTIILTRYDINWISHTANDFLCELALVIGEGEGVVALTNPNPLVCDFFP